MSGRHESGSVLTIAAAPPPVIRCLRGNFSITHLSEDLLSLLEFLGVPNLGGVPAVMLITYSLTPVY